MNQLISVIKYFALVCVMHHVMVSAVLPQSTAAHQTNKLSLWVYDGGSLGELFRGLDPFTGDSVIGSSYPRQSHFIVPLVGTIFGAIVNEDTVTTTFGINDREAQPGLAISGGVLTGSRQQSGDHASRRVVAVSRPLLLDSLATVSRPGWPVALPNKQLQSRLVVESISWNSPNTDDFVLSKYSLTNLSGSIWKEVFLGHTMVNYSGSYSADSGTFGKYDKSVLIRNFPTANCTSGSQDIVWTGFFSISGCPLSSSWNSSSILSAFGLAVIHTPGTSRVRGINWFASIAGSLDPREFSYGPRRIENANNYTFQHSPSNYGEEYRVLALSEIDYSQLFSASLGPSQGWIFLDTAGLVLARSELNSPYVFVSAGPIGISPGETVEWVIALVGGDSVHTDPTAYDRLFDPLNPYPFYNQLNFEPLKENAKWASWVYDNPGIDTDGDGYRGEFEICNANPDAGFIGDTLWYQGDGIPDYRADLPPPSPPTRIYTSEGKLVIRWNGFDVEKTIDPFTRKMDFQGYKVYLGRDPRLESLVLQSQWDKEDYIALKFVLRADGGGDWVPYSEPLSLDSITDYYDLPEHPLSYTRSKSYNFNNANYYFEKQDNNVSDLANFSGIHKAYPDAIPPANADSLLWTESEYTTEHGRKFPKYTEYEYVIDGILPSVPYYACVSAFDHGFVLGGMPPQESDPVKTLQQTLALPSADSVEANNLDAYCYPNPYRIDDNYIERGYENRDNSIPDQKAGRIHFANLPRKCTISIFSLDGDRIWSYDHNPATYSANDMHAEWDLISRNRQLVVSGLYYWVVESETRTQIGKLMILK